MAALCVSALSAWAASAASAVSTVVAAGSCARNAVVSCDCNVVSCARNDDAITKTAKKTRTKEMVNRFFINSIVVDGRSCGQLGLQPAICHVPPRYTREHGRMLEITSFPQGLLLSSRSNQGVCCGDRHQRRDLVPTFVGHLVF